MSEMDHSYAGPESSDVKNSVDGPPDTDHNYFGAKVKLEKDIDEMSEDSEVASENLTEKQKVVDQNQNSAVQSDQEMKVDVTKKTVESSDVKDGDEAKDDSGDDTGLIMDVDENSCDTTNSGADAKDGGGDKASQIESSQIDSSQAESSQFDSSQVDSSQNTNNNNSSIHGDEDDMDGLESLMSNIAENTKDLDMDMLLRPFKEGWKREVVQRNVFEKYSASGRRKSKPVDIYYFTPEGRKLRSMIQINDYLSRSSSLKLPAACFCFMRKPIYREPFEIVRSAGKSRRSYDSPSSVSPIKRGRHGKGNKMSPKPTLKPNRTKSSIPEPEVVIERDEDEFCVTPYLNMAIEAAASRKRSLDDVTSPAPPPPIKKKATARKSTTPRPPGFHTKTTVTLPAHLERSEGQLCTINCPGLEGQPPELTCSQCMCLFHPKCVNAENDVTSANFKCHRCRLLPNGTCNSTPIAPKTTSYTMVFPKPPTPKLSQNMNSTLRTYLDSKSPQLTALEIPPLPPLKMATSTIPRTALPLLKPSPGISMVPPKLIAAPGTIPLRTIAPQCVISPPKPQLGLTPQTPVIVQKPSKETPVNAQLLTLPTAVTKRLNLNQPLALKINNVHIVVPPNCVINSKEGLKVVLPPNTFGLPTDPSTKLNVTVSNNSGGVEGFKPVSDTAASDSASLSVNGSASSVNGSANSVNTLTGVKSSVNKDSVCDISSVNSKLKLSNKKRKFIEGINPAYCYVKSLYGGYDCMLFIFRYLSTHDLLRVGQVCKTWHNISQHLSLWRVIRLKDVKIPDWEIACKFIRKVGVQRLSLKGLHHFDDRNRTWHQLMANLYNLVALQEITFGLVPATVLHSVCEKLQSLQVFSAEFISDSNTEQMWNTPTKIDIGKLSKLEYLQELRLRGLGGLVLPNTSNSGSLSNLTQLKQLKILSLTSLRSFEDSDFTFLSELKNLTSLEIGDCSPWKRAYESLGELVKLKRLRLECGGDFNNTTLADSLSKLQSLEELELVMFIVPDNLSEKIHHLKKLFRFVIWPYIEDTDEDSSLAQLNSNTLNSISKLCKLLYLEWGIVLTNDSSSPSKIVDSLKFQPGRFESNSVSIQELTETLCSIMPDTEKIRVFRTQPLNHTKCKSKDS